MDSSFSPPGPELSETQTAEGFDGSARPASQAEDAQDVEMGKFGVVLMREFGDIWRFRCDLINVFP